MKKNCIFLAVFAALLLTAMQRTGVAETSTNLKVDRVMTAFDKLAQLTYLDENGQPVMADDVGYATVRYTYGNRQETMAEYFDVNGEPVNNADGYARRVQAWNSSRRLVEQAYYNVDGDLVLGPDGFARQVNTYDEGRLIQTLQYGEDGELLRSEETFARYTATYFVNQYDKHKREKEEYFDADGKPFNCEDGYASVHYEYVAQTHLCGTTYLDQDGNPVMHATLGYARMEKTYEDGHFTKIAYYDESGHLTLPPHGYAYIVYEYKKGSNKPSKEMFFDEFDRPCMQSGGYYGIKRAYDKYGRVKEEQYFDAEGNPCNHELGYAKLQKDYATNWRLKETRYYDEKNALMVVPALGYARVRNTFVRQTEIGTTTYYDAAGKIVNCNEGYAQIRYTYDDNKMLVKQAYLDADGQPVLCADGYSMVEHTNDEELEIRLSTVYLDTQGSPVQIPAGYSSIRYTYYDEKVGTASYFDLEDQPVRCKAGYHQIGYKYTTDGDTAETCFYDLNGEVVNCTSGYAIRRYTYTERENEEDQVELLSTQYYTKEGELAQLGKEYAYTNKVFNGDRTSYVLTYYGSENEPVVLSAGYAQVEGLLNQRTSWFWKPSSIWTDSL